MPEDCQEKRILIVDDDSVIRLMLSTMLKHFGYEVHAVADGLQALEYLRNTLKLPSLILLDLMMPVMTGQEFRQEQIVDPRFSKIPVIVFSAVKDLDEQALSLGINEFLPKPVKMDTLYETVTRYCH